uniref:Uncharacterized protein n=1 Tax=Romanomermis culicivorax TaxID=13658 RepID=A0A915JF17_ROMCU
MGPAQQVLLCQHEACAWNRHPKERVSYKANCSPASAAHPRGIGTPFRSDNSILPRATVVVAMSKQKLSP